MNASHVALAVVAIRGAVDAAPPATLEPDDLAPPVAEVGSPIDVPTVPTFALPPASSDGHSVKELRVAGKRFLDTEITVKGVVTWAYDCPTAIRKSGETDRDVRKRIDDDPTSCERPKFYVGDNAQTPPELSLWVVDVPRPYNKLEMTRMAKADRTAPDRCEPGEKDPARKICPPYRAGDVVTVTGSFRLSSPHSERNSDGLLVYKAMKNTTLSWETPGATWPATSVSTAVAPHTRPVVQLPGRTMRRIVDRATRDGSASHAAAATRAFGLQQLDVALDEYKKAIDGWDGNHVAWYGTGGVHARRGDWPRARDAFAQAVQRRPDAAMYQMWLGIALYELAYGQAREDMARRLNVKPEDAPVDEAAINFEKPLDHLLVAVKLEPALWRAHYYIGKIDRASERPKQAADEFSAAIHAGASSGNPYIALAELYRRWDYIDQAIAVATAGTAHVVGDAELSDVWFEVGMGYEDKGRDVEAIEAFGKAIALRRTNDRAVFQRGQAYFRHKDFVHAKADLEAFAKTTKPSLEFARGQATMMLMDMASRHK